MDKVYVVTAIDHANCGRMIVQVVASLEEAHKRELDLWKEKWPPESNVDRFSDVTTYDRTLGVGRDYV